MRLSQSCVRLNVGMLQVRGTVRFVGATQFYSGSWVGVELDDKLGKNNGTVKGHSYFQCAPQHGLFVRPSEVQLRSDTAYVAVQIL